LYIYRILAVQIVVCLDLFLRNQRRIQSVRVTLDVKGEMVRGHVHEHSKWTGPAPLSGSWNSYANLSLDYPG
jgi:hypothetical protein